MPFTILFELKVPAHFWPFGQAEGSANKMSYSLKIPFTVGGLTEILSARPERSRMVAKEETSFKIKLSQVGVSPRSGSILLMHLRRRSTLLEAYSRSSRSEEIPGYR